MNESIWGRAEVTFDGIPAGEPFEIPTDAGLAYPLAPREHAPEWDVTEIRAFGRAEPLHCLRPCAHANAIPVISRGQLVAHLCIDCDAQLP